VIGLPPNLFYSTGIPVCILVLKRCKKPNNVLFINASEHFDKGKKQNRLTPEHIAKIIDAYRNRSEEQRYSRRVGMEEIEKNDYNLKISRCISTSVGEEEIDLSATHRDLVSIEGAIQAATAKHNTVLDELGLPPLP
jgi:type I restriction enzyme M protein